MNKHFVTGIDLHLYADPCFDNEGSDMFTNRMRPDANNVVGDGTHFERIRRITGYLNGSLDRFNNAKKAEVKDRVKHMSFKDPTK